MVTEVPLTRLSSRSFALLCVVTSAVFYGKSEPTKFLRNSLDIASDVLTAGNLSTFGDGPSRPNAPAVSDPRNKTCGTMVLACLSLMRRFDGRALPCG